MAGIFTSVNEIVEIVAILVTVISGYYMYRHGTTSYNDARNLIVAVHALFATVIVFELISTALSTSPGTIAQQSLLLYLTIGILLILLCVQLLTMLAWSVYLPIQKSGLRNLLEAIYQNRTNFLAFVAGTVYIAFVAVYLIVASPYTYETIPFPSYQFDTLFLGLLFGVLILFMGYTSTIFASARRKSNLANVKRALVLLPLAWIGIGVDLLVFNSISSAATLDVDISPFGYLIAALGLAATSTIFRRASLLAGFFETRKQASGAGGGQKIPASPLQSTPRPVNPAFSKRLALKDSSFSGRKYLLEVDSSASYERIVSDFANELIELDYPMFVFTARGSPIYNTLKSGLTRFYLLSASVSYTTVSSVPTEVLVPQNDPAVLLDAIQKTLETDPVSPIGMVFDNISDFILTLGLETSYKFLKKILEAIDSDRITALFLMTEGAHGERETNLIRSLFANQIRFDAKGFEATRIA